MFRISSRSIPVPVTIFLNFLLTFVIAKILSVIKIFNAVICTRFKILTKNRLNINLASTEEMPVEVLHILSKPQ
jgi:hypothetical protein